MINNTSERKTTKKLYIFLSATIWSYILHIHSSQSSFIISITNNPSSSSSFSSSFKRLNPVFTLKGMNYAIDILDQEVPASFSNEESAITTATTDVIKSSSIHQNRVDRLWYRLEKEAHAKLTNYILEDDDIVGGSSSSSNSMDKRRKLANVHELEG